MRKELLVYVNTTERGSEISLTALSNNRDFVLVNSPNGKFTANRQELVEALKAIEEFDSINNVASSEPLILVRSSTNLVAPVSDDIEYGEE